MLEAIRAKHKGYITGISDTFVRACKALKLPFEWHEPYRQWLIATHRTQTGSRCTDNDLPTTKNDRGIIPRLQAHWFLPYPTGSTWIKTKSTVSARNAESINHDIEQAITNELSMIIRSQKDSVRAGNAFVFNKTSQSQAVYQANMVAAYSANRKKKKRAKAALGDQTAPPSSVRQALESDQGQEWARSMASEMDGLTKMGVLIHDKTRGDLHAEGILTKPWAYTSTSN